MPLRSLTEELLALGDAGPPDALRERVAASGERVRATLLALATESEYRGPSAEDGGFAPGHALELLGTLPPDAATAERLVASVLEDPHAEEFDAIVDVLAAMGVHAIPALLTSLAAAQDGEATGWLAEALVKSNVRTDSVFAALLARFGDFPDMLAPLVGDFGDDRALPVLRHVLDAHVVGEGQTPQHEERFIACADAILALGGELTLAQERKLNEALSRQNRLLRRRLPRVEAVLEENETKLARLREPGPNDPCPCGSGRKFKKCHEGDEAFGTGVLDRVGEEEP